MSKVQTGAERTPHDLSHLIFSMGEIGRLQTLSTVNVIGGDSFQQNLVGSLKLSPLRRGLSMDSVVDVFSFYIPHRYAYDQDWVDFLKDGVHSDALPSGSTVTSANTYKLNHLGVNIPIGNKLNYPMPKWLEFGYNSIWNNYFKYPWASDETRSINDFTESEGNFGLACANLKTIWTTPLPPERDSRDFEIDVSGSTATLNIQDLNKAYGMLNTDQERELYAQRFRDVVSSLGGSTTADADQRPRLMGRSTTWASGYDVDGTSEVSLGQYTGRVNQAINHKVNRFYVPEHGTVWTVALVRFPPVHRYEANYLARKPRPSYGDIIGDPSIVGNHPTVELVTSDLFNLDGFDNFSLGKHPHSQWYRHQAPVVHGKYVDLQGFPFLSAITGVVNSVGGEDGVPSYIQPYEFDGIFQTTQMAHWNMQAKNNIKIMRRLPTARDSIMTS